MIATLKWTHPEQTRELGEHLLQAVAAQRLEVVMEPSGTYGDALQRYLTGLGLAVYRASPKRVHDVAEVYDGVPSLHDAKSAYLIARLHLDGASRLWEDLPESRRHRQALVGELDLYQDQQQRNRNRLEALLSRHWPEVGRVVDLKRVSLLRLVAEYGDPQRIAAHREEADQLLRHGTRGGLSGEKIEQILVNLVSNAVKFTKQGSVSVEVSLRRAARTEVELMFAVRDTGVGSSRGLVRSR